MAERTRAAAQGGMKSKPRALQEPISRQANLELLAGRSYCVKTLAHGSGVLAGAVIERHRAPGLADKTRTFVR